MDEGGIRCMGSKSLGRNGLVPIMGEGVGIMVGFGGGWEVI